MAFEAKWLDRGKALMLRLTKPFFLRMILTRCNRVCEWRGSICLQAVGVYSSLQDDS
jgi:hypothetical protein